MVVIRRSNPYVVREDLVTVAENVTSQVHEIRYGKRRFRLKKPIDIKAFRKQGLYGHELPELGISVAEKDQLASLKAFAQEFDACWWNIAQEDDSKLTADARRLKKRMLRLVVDVY
jgi:hypothetical protein